MRFKTVRFVMYRAFAAGALILAASPVLTMRSAVLVPPASAETRMTVLQEPETLLSQGVRAPDSELDRLMQQGCQHFINQDFQSAIKSYQQALNVTLATDNWQGAWLALDGLGASHFYAQQYAQASEVAQRMMALASQAGGDDELEAMAQDRITLSESYRLHQQGVTYAQAGQFQSALESFQQALQLYRERGDRYGEARSLNDLGVAYVDLGQYDQAATAYQQALTLASTINDPAFEQSLISNAEDLENALRNR